MVITPEMFGAAGDGVTDDTTAIQSAINAAQAIGAGTVLARTATYAISQTLSITKDFIRLVGGGAGFDSGGTNPLTGTTLHGATILKWIGAAAGTTPMVWFNAPAGSSDTNQGCAAKGILLDGNGLAGIGFQATSVSCSEFSDLAVQGVTNKAYWFNCLTSFTAVTGIANGPGDDQMWLIKRCFFDLVSNPASQNADGFYFDGDAALTADFSLCIVEDCHGQHWNGAGYVLHFCDSVQFINCNSFADNYVPANHTNAHGGGATFVCHGNSGAGFSSGDGNTWYGCQWGAFVLQGTESGWVSGTSGNNIGVSCVGNPSPFPVIGTGCSFLGPLDSTTFFFGGQPAWSPTVTSQAGAITSYAVNQASWSYHGKKVFFSLNVTITTKGTAAGYMAITMPPIDFSASGGNFAFPVLQGFNGSQGIALVGYSLDATTMYFVAYDNTTPFIADGDTIIVSGWYDIN